MSDLVHPIPVVPVYEFVQDILRCFGVDACFLLSLFDFRRDTQRLLVLSSNMLANI